MDKKAKIGGLICSEKLPIQAIPVSVAMIEKFFMICEANVCGPKGAAEAIAQVCTPACTEKLLEWMLEHREEMVYCPENGVKPMLEAVALAAQGVKRIEHAVHYLYLCGLKKNLMHVYNCMHQDNEQPSKGK